MVRIFVLSYITFHFSKVVVDVNNITLKNEQHKIFAEKLIMQDLDECLMYNIEGIVEILNYQLTLACEKASFKRYPKEQIKKGSFKNIVLKHKNFLFNTPNIEFLEDEMTKKNTHAIINHEYTVQHDSYILTSTAPIFINRTQIQADNLIIQDRNNSQFQANIKNLFFNISKKIGNLKTIEVKFGVLKIKIKEIIYNDENINIENILCFLKDFKIASKNGKFNTTNSTIEIPIISILSKKINAKAKCVLNIKKQIIFLTNIVLKTNKKHVVIKIERCTINRDQKAILNEISVFYKNRKIAFSKKGIFNIKTQEVILNDGELNNVSSN